MLSRSLSPLSCCSSTVVTLCSTTSGDAAGKRAVTLTCVGANWGRSSRPKPESDTSPANRTSRLQTTVRTGRRRNGWEMDRKAAPAAQANRSWQLKAPVERLSAQQGLCVGLLKRETFFVSSRSKHRQLFSQAPERGGYRRATKQKQHHHSHPARSHW